MHKNQWGDVIYDSPAEFTIRERLASTEVDEEWAKKHIEQALAEIQEGWTGNQRAAKCAYETPEVEVREYHRAVRQGREVYESRDQ